MVFVKMKQWGRFSLSRFPHILILKKYSLIIHELS